MNKQFENCPFCNGSVILTQRVTFLGVDNYIVCNHCDYKCSVEGYSTTEIMDNWNRERRINLLQHKVEELEQKLGESYWIINQAMNWHKNEQEEKDNTVSGNITEDNQLKFRVYDPVRKSYLTERMDLSDVPENCIVEMCLGLYDKADNLIYSGDVLKVFYYDTRYALFDVLWNKKRCRFEFVRHNEAGHIHQTWYTLFVDGKAPLVQIVGTIHDYDGKED